MKTLKLQLQRAGITHEAIALRAGVTRGYVSQQLREGCLTDGVRAAMEELLTERPAELIEQAHAALDLLANQNDANAKTAAATAVSGTPIKLPRQELTPW